MSSLLERRRNITKLIVALVAAAAATRLPITTVTVPAWNVQIVDAAGRGVNGACVSQTWQQYSFEPEGHSEDVKADKSGHVRFPQRTARATLWQRVARPFSQLGHIHSSFGASSWIIAGAPRLQGSALYNPKEKLPTTIILEQDSTQFEWEKGSIAKRCSPV